MCFYPEKKQVKHEPNLQSAILNQLLPVMGVTYMGSFRYSSVEETGSFEAKFARSLPQFDQMSSVTGDTVVYI